MWVKNHFQIHENIFNSNAESRLTVDLSSDDAFGNYTCSAFNEIGDLKQVYEVIEKQDYRETSGTFQTLPSAALMMSIIVLKNFFF